MAGNSCAETFPALSDDHLISALTYSTADHHDLVDAAPAVASQPNEDVWDGPCNAASIQWEEVFAILLVIVVVVIEEGEMGEVGRDSISDGLRWEEAVLEPRVFRPRRLDRLAFVGHL
uniref:Uncharacterized protein n=1 Tax=Oryza sativa subsp. japonica TaxID=39947 RepID=Q6Z3Q3_ORYSJ|nr:hypothetical protein [Oryza sativa Japonica Group]